MKKLFTSMLIGLLLFFIAFFAVIVQADDGPHFIASDNCCASIPFTVYAGADAVFINASWHHLSSLDTLPEIAALEPIKKPHALAFAALLPGIILNTQGDPPCTSFGTSLHKLLG